MSYLVSDFAAASMPAQETQEYGMAHSDQAPGSILGAQVFKRCRRTSLDTIKYRMSLLIVPLTSPDLIAGACSSYPKTSFTVAYKSH